MGVMKKFAGQKCANSIKIILIFIGLCGLLFSSCIFSKTIMLDSYKENSKYPCDSIASCLPLASSGNTKAQTKLGELYALTLNLKNITLSYYWLETAAKQGDHQAQADMGSSLLGLAGSKNSCEMLMQSVINFNNQQNTQREAVLKNILGSFSNYDLHNQQDRASICANKKAKALVLDPFYQAAFNWNMLAASHNNIDAQNNLGLMYENGFGVPQDGGKAFDWFMKAAQQGDGNAEANLGVMYLGRDDFPKNYQMAFYWFKKSADQGIIQGKIGLASLYYNGLGCPQDFQKAHDLYLQSAQQGSNDAQAALGLMLASGNNAEDLLQAYAWLNIAIAQGNVTAIPLFTLTKTRDAIYAQLTTEQQKQAGKLSETYWGKYVLHS